jgi:hypothetical protein
MAERDPSPNGTERDVLGSLPRTRPARRSAKRGAPAGAATPAPLQAASTRPRAPRAPKAARPAGRAAARTQSQRRSAPSSVSPPVPAAGYATPGAPSGDGERRHPGLLGTAVQAAGEVAQLGFTVGAQALRGALGRLPRP